MPLTVLLGGCTANEQDEDMVAMATCTSEVEVRAPGQDLRATVRDEPAGTWVVNVWADEPAEGIPDYVCEVVRDRQAETGFRVRRLRPED